MRVLARARALSRLKPALHSVLGRFARLGIAA
nr:MAG TPA: hypothetical protein [Caudoviricetes sp.]